MQEIQQTFCVDVGILRLCKASIDTVQIENAKPPTFSQHSSCIFSLLFFVFMMIEYVHC